MNYWTNTLEGVSDEQEQLTKIKQMIRDILNIHANAGQLIMAGFAFVYDNELYALDGVDFPTWIDDFDTSGLPEVSIDYMRKIKNAVIGTFPVAQINNVGALQLVSVTPVSTLVNDIAPSTRKGNIDEGSMLELSRFMQTVITGDTSDIKEAGKQVKQSRRAEPKEATFRQEGDKVIITVPVIIWPMLITLLSKWLKFKEE